MQNLEISDPTLLDNATGSYNVNAPGAHRLKIDLSLSKSPGSTGTTNNRKAVTDFYILGYFDIDENNNSYKRITGGVRPFSLLASNNQYRALLTFLICIIKLFLTIPSILHK